MEVHVHEPHLYEPRNTRLRNTPLLSNPGYRCLKVKRQTENSPMLHKQAPSRNAQRSVSDASILVDQIRQQRLGLDIRRCPTPTLEEHPLRPSYLPHVSYRRSTIPTSSLLQHLFHPSLLPW